MVRTMPRVHLGDVLGTQNTGIKFLSRGACMASWVLYQIMSNITLDLIFIPA